MESFQTQQPQYDQQPQSFQTQQPQSFQQPSQRQVNITSIPSLYDLNGKEANFSIRVHIEAPGYFEYAIASQTDIDNEKVSYRQGSQHVMENVSNSTNDYQNYFLLLRSNEPTNGVFWVEQLPKDIPTQQIQQIQSSQSSKGGGISLLLWVIVIVGIVMMMRKRK